MSKALKITVLAASALLLVGITLWTVGGIRSGSFFPLRKGSETVEQREKQFDEAIERVQIEEVSAEVELYPAEDGVCRVVYSETEREKLELSVKDGTLSLKRKSGSNWGFFSFGSLGQEFGPTKLYLPEAVYEKIDIEAVSGDVSLERGISAARLNVKTVSGEIAVPEMEAEQISTYSVSGDQRVNHATAGELSCESTSGNITLDACDAQKIKLETVSGDVNAKLLSEKEITTSTVSGDVSVPNNRQGASPCQVETVSGDIRVETP